MPTGGPKDVNPPKEVKSIPPNHSRNFNQKNVRIYFDEFVTLKDVAGQVIISPPLEKMPEFSLRGKSVVIGFNEKFKENTTYTIFLGSAIADITENNIKSNFEYVFSTGNTIDSLSIKGKVVNAFDNQPEKGILVMLYIETYDSIPYKEKPYYLTRTDESGTFALNNLSAGKYKLFALMDANSNYLYDLPNEAIAFSDSLVVPEYFSSLQPDTTLNDSLNNAEIATDTSKPVFYELFLFEETDTVQRVVRAFSPIKGKMVLIFRKTTNYPVIRVLNHDYDTTWFIEDFNPTNDTLTYWILNFEKDTLLLEISDYGMVPDTNEVVISTEDSQDKRRIKDDDIEQSRKMAIVSNAKRSFDYYEKLLLTSTYPIKETDFSGALFIEREDTLMAELNFINSIKREIRLDYDLKENTNYRLIIPDSSLTDIYGSTNDSITIDFITNSADDYGTLKLKLLLPPVEHNYIIQLITEKELVIRQNNITNDTVIIYKHLKPAKYLLKAVADKNNNSKWDTGDYINRVQPEKVYYSPAKINIRSKWDIEEEWEL